MFNFKSVEDFEITKRTHSYQSSEEVVELFEMPTRE